MTLKLVVTTNVNGDVFELILNDSVYRVGRHGDNDLRIKETYVSGYHSELRRTEEGDYELVDCGSSNGTFLNGERIEAPEKIQAGDFIKFGILKVAVKEHGEAADPDTGGESSEDGPCIVSLRDRPAFAKRREALTSAVSARETTGKIGSSTQSIGAAEPASSPIGGADPDETILDLRSQLEEARAEVDRLRGRNDEVSKARGELQAELNRESSEKERLQSELEASREKSSELHEEAERLRQSLADRERTIEEGERNRERSRDDAVFELEQKLSDAAAEKRAAEEAAERARREKQSLSGSFARLEEQLAASESTRREAAEREQELRREKEELRHRLDQTESSNSELAARIKEEASGAIASRKLIEKLEIQLRAAESEAEQRAADRISELNEHIGDLERELNNERSRAEKLDAALERTNQAKDDSENRNQELHERVLELESEEKSMKDLLRRREGEKSRLSTQLEEQTTLASDRGRTIADLEQRLHDTVDQSRESEDGLLEKHRQELGAVRAELQREREQRQSLETCLDHTRHGFSQALRYGHLHGEREKSAFLAERNARLSEMEEELSRVIHSRREVESDRDELEDALNERDERIEGLVERVEDLELQLQDEREERQTVLADLDRTREGFSRSLDATRNHLARALRFGDESEQARLEAEDEATASAKEIERLSGELASERERFEAEISEWEGRYEKLREEKLTLASEDADLKRLRDQIDESNAAKKELETELKRLNGEVETVEARCGELRKEKDELVGEREEMKSTLEANRAELEKIQKQCAASRNEEEKLAETISSAEHRIQSLRRLEAEIEQAVEKKRQQDVVSRGAIFSDDRPSGAEKAPAANGHFADEDFYRALIAKLDLLDDLTKRYDGKWRYPKVSEQLALLKSSFLDFLQDHSVDEFNLEPGAEVSLEERKRIKLVPPEAGAGKTNGHASSRNGHTSRVLETVRPGYVYRDGSGDVVIRKAEVKIGKKSAKIL